MYVSIQSLPYKYLYFLLTLDVFSRISHNSPYIHLLKIIDNKKNAAKKKLEAF